MNNGVVLIGAKETQEFFDKYAKEAKEDLDMVLAKAAVNTHRTAIINIQTGSRSGKLYVKKNGTTHRASAIGEYPKTDTGALTSNIIIRTKMRDLGSRLRPLSAKAVSNGSMNYSVGSRAGAPHGFYLELKSPLRGGRRWLSRAHEETMRKFREIMNGR